MKILSIAESLKAITDKLDQGLNIYYTRFGDNDIFQISGTNHMGESMVGRTMGGNRTKFSFELQRELKDSFVIKDGSYLRALSGAYPKEFGMKPGLFEPFPYKQTLESKIKALTAEREFFNPVLFQYLFVFKPQIFEQFVQKYIRGGKTLFIGSVDQEYVEQVLGKVDYIKTPSKGCYEQIDNWYPEVIDKINKNNYDTIIPNCGQASRVLQKRLWKLDVNALSLDLGSIFDAVAGLKTRTWIKIKGAEIKKRYGNQGG